MNRNDDNDEIARSAQKHYTTRFDFIEALQVQVAGLEPRTSWSPAEAFDHYTTISMDHAFQEWYSSNWMRLFIYHIAWFL